MTRNLRRLLFYFGYLFVVWGSFRYWIRLPEVVEELWFKPLIWLLPLIWWQFSIKPKLHFFQGGWKSTLGWGLLGGGTYFVLFRILGVTNIPMDLNILGMAFVTAVVEELTFSGFILSVLVSDKKGEWLSLMMTALAFGLIHLPVNIFVFHLAPVTLIGAFFLAFFVAMINGFIRLRSDNVFSAIIAHFVYLLLVLG